jgi:hypothetical protein
MDGILGGRRRRRSFITGGALLALAAAAAVPLGAHAATSSTATLLLGGGGLSISGMSAYTTASVPASTGTVATPLNTATWADTTGTGSGWNGNVAVTQFVDQGAWSQTSGTTTALASTTSGAYTGTAGAGSITVTVTQALDTVVATTLSISYSDSENGTVTNGTATATKGSATALVNGITIKFATLTAYPQNATYQVHFGILPTTALSLDTAQATVSAAGTTQGGTNLPAFINNNTTVTAGGPSTLSTTPIKFISAASGTGIGSFTVAGGAMITWDPNNVWQASYTASVQYNIVSGP